MVTWLTSSHNQLRSPTGASNEAPDGPGAFQALRDDVDSYLGASGAEWCSSLTAIKAIPSGRLYDGKEARAADTNIVYRYYGGSWFPWSSSWRTYTPTYTNFATGTGTFSQRYKFADGIVWTHTFVSVWTGFSVGTAPTWTLPHPAYNPNGGNTQEGSMIQGGGYANPSNGTDFWPLVPVLVSVGGVYQLRPKLLTIVGSYTKLADLSATVPFTWASANILALTAQYRPDAA